MPFCMPKCLYVSCKVGMKTFWRDIFQFGLTPPPYAASKWKPKCWQIVFVLTQSNKSSFNSALSHTHTPYPTKKSDQDHLSVHVSYNSPLTLWRLWTVRKVTPVCTRVTSGAHAPEQAWWRASIGERTAPLTSAGQVSWLQLRLFAWNSPIRRDMVQAWEGAGRRHMEMRAFLTHDSGVCVWLPIQVCWMRVAYA